MTWLIWFMLCFGLVYLVVGASITQWPRRFLFNVLGPRWGGWLACAPCCAFWVGLAIGVPEQAFLAAALPIWALGSSFAVTVAGHLVAGLIIMGGVVLVQLATRSLIAEIGAEAAAKKAKGES